MNTIRKCMTITKVNKQYVEDLIDNQQAKNFSNAVNRIIDERREQNEVEDGIDRNQNTI